MHLLPYINILVHNFSRMHFQFNLPLNYRDVVILFNMIVIADWLSKAIVTLMTARKLLQLYKPLLKAQLRTLSSSPIWQVNELQQNPTGTHWVPLTKLPETE